MSDLPYAAEAHVGYCLGMSFMAARRR